MMPWLFGTFCFLLVIGTPIGACLGLAAVVTIIMTAIPKDQAECKSDLA